MMQVAKSLILRSPFIRSLLSKIFRFLVNLQGLIGQQLLSLAPERAALIRQEDFSFTMGQKRSLLDSFLWAGLVREAMRTNSSSSLEKYHYDFWQGKRGHQYHDCRQERFEEIFLCHYSYIIDELTALIRANSGYTTLCEIGSGSGQLLDYLASNMPEINRFIGIDLSEETTASNRQKYTKPKLEFIAAGGLEWIQEHGQPFWIYVTNGGVLEYFSQPNVEALFEHIGRTSAPAIFVAIEPISIDHNLETELNSKPYGREFAFSHNYPHLFRKAGFQLRHMDYSHQKPGHNLYAFIATVDKIGAETDPNHEHSSV